MSVGRKAAKAFIIMAPALLVQVSVLESAPVPAKRLNKETVAISTVQQLADYLNAGLTEIAAGVLPVSWKTDGKALSPAQQLSSLVDGGVIASTGPTLIVAKRRARLLPNGLVEVRCVLIWNITHIPRLPHRFVCNERFVVDASQNSGRIISAIALPIVLEHQGSPRKLERELSSLDWNRP